MNDLTSGSVKRHILDLAIPTSVGFFFYTMYNVVDTYYAGMLSTEALAALSLSFPVFFLIIAIAVGMGTGSTALVSNALGEKDQEKARSYLTQSISYALLWSLLLTVFGFYSIEPLFVMLGAEGEFLKLAVSYMRVIYSGAVFFILAEAFNAGLSALGDTKPYRNFLFGSFLLNVFLNPLFMYGAEVFGGWGIPALGFDGIAFATITTEALGSAYLLRTLLSKGFLSKECFKYWVPNLSIYLELTKQALPAAINMLTIAGGTFIVLYFVGDYGEQAVAAFGVGMRIAQIALLPGIGLNRATLTIVGQNNGAKKIERIRETYKTALRFNLLIASFGMLPVFVFAKDLAGFFSSDPEVLRICQQYLRIEVFVFWAYSVLFIATSCLQGLKRPYFAIYLGLFRQIVGLGVSIYFFSKVLGLGLLGVWWGIFAVTWLAAGVTLFYTRGVIRKLV